MLSMLCESEHLGKYRCLFVIFTVHNSVDSFRLSLTVSVLENLLARGKLLYHLYGIFMSFVMFHQDVVIMGYVESGFHCKKSTGF